MSTCLKTFKTKNRRYVNTSYLPEEQLPSGSVRDLKSYVVMCMKFILNKLDTIVSIKFLKHCGISSKVSMWQSDTLFRAVQSKELYFDDFLSFKKFLNQTGIHIYLKKINKNPPTISYNKRKKRHHSIIKYFYNISLCKFTEDKIITNQSSSKLLNYIFMITKQSEKQQKTVPINYRSNL